MLEKKTRPGFVPEAEQPYKIPQNWRWVRFSALVSPSKETTADFSADTRYVGLEHMETGRGIVSCGNAQTVKSLKNVFHDGQILYGKLRPYLNKHDIANFSGVCSTDILVFNQSEYSCAQYVNYYFDLPYFLEYVISHSRGINLPRVTESILLNAVCPLPPLAEQARIVERIEGLFAKLDAARENAQAVVDAFETRKAAILYRAFSGELTAEWRETHNVGLSDWRKLLLRDIGEIVTGSTPNTKEKAFYGGSVPFIKPAELNQGRHVARSADTLTDAGKALSRPVRAGATCICCIGSIGKCGMLDMDAVTNQQINSVVPYDFMDDVYVYYYCCSNGFKNALIANSCATTISIINKRKTGLLPIVVPPKAEQQEIARILDGLFEAEGQGKQAAELVIEQIDAMKKVVLGRAFRGELGTNRPGEPPCDIVRTETEGDSI